MVADVTEEKGCDFSPCLHSILPLDDAGSNNEFVRKNQFGKRTQCNIFNFFICNIGQLMMIM